MITAYFDCFAGISGDMITGAFIDAGLDYQALEKYIMSLDLQGYKISSGKKLKNGISGTSFSVSVTAQQPRRGLPEIIDIIHRSSLTEKMKADAVSVFNILGRAEAHVHNTSIGDVHFHEIGGVDSIIDICSAAVAFNHMGIEKTVSSPVNTGRGYVNTMHGVLPVPAPATAEILKGIPLYSTETETELTTPTGAAILAYYAGSFSSLPEIKIRSIGYGAGTKDIHIPNLLRIYIGETPSMPDTGYDEVAEIETNIDDMNPEFYSPIMSMLMEDGALDVLLIPVYMKKNRPGHILKVLATAEKRDDIVKRIFEETSTSGIRIKNAGRRILARKTAEVETSFGKISVKIHEMNGKPVTVSPEYEECRMAAVEYNVPLKTVYSEAIEEAKKLIYSS